MGDIADWQLEQAFDSDYEEDEFFDGASTGIWTTKTGEQIPICKLTDQHILNIIRYFERRPEDNFPSAELSAVWDEADRRNLDVFAVLL